MKVAAAVAGMVLAASAAQAQPLTCTMTGYTASSGLTAAVVNDALELTWDGEASQELRLRFVLQGGAPVIRELAVRKKGGSTWAALATNVTPEFKVVTGYRRATDQQIKPLQDLGVEITSQVIDDIKWEAFWDAPLNVPGDADAHGGSTPPKAGIAHQPGLPRKPEEVARAEAKYRVTGCEVKTTGGRLEVAFPGVELGVFSGRLEYTVYKGTNLIKQAVVAKTEEPSVAYKYDAGLKGLALRPGTADGVARHQQPLAALQLRRRRTTRAWSRCAPANRLAVAEVPGGSIAAFPPPHTLLLVARDRGQPRLHLVPQGQRQRLRLRHPPGRDRRRATVAGRGEEDFRQNFALYSARPGTWQQMPVFFYVGAGAGADDAAGGAELHPQRRLQAAARLQDHGPRISTPTRCRGAEALGRLDVADSRLRHDAGARHQHLRARSTAAAAAASAAAVQPRRAAAVAGRLLRATRSATPTRTSC